MIKLIIRHTNAEIEEKVVEDGMKFQPLEGEQFYFIGSDGYTFTLSGNESTVNLSLMDGNERVSVSLDNMADLIKANNPGDAFALTTALGVSSTPDGAAEIEQALADPNLESAQIIDVLKENLSESTVAENDGAIIDNFGSLAEGS